MYTSVSDSHSVSDSDGDSDLMLIETVIQGDVIVVVTVVAL